MNSRRSLLAAALLAFLALAGCAAMAEGRAAPPVAGDSWLLLDGREDSAVVEGKWGLVVFFRPHLPDCNAGIGEVLALRERFEGRGLVVVGVTPDGEDPAREFILRHGLPFPVLAGARSVMQAWGLPDMWGNRTYLVNPSGTVLAQDDLASASRILEKYLPQ